MNADAILKAMALVKRYEPSTVWVLSRNTPLIYAEAIASAGYRIRWADPIGPSEALEL